MKLRLAILALVAVVAGLAMGQGMAFGKTLVLGSPVQGQLVYGDGRPAAGVRVTREWDWAFGKKTGVEEATTDEEGNFSFGEVTGKSFLAGVVPHEPLIDHAFFAHGDGDPVNILLLVKRSYDTNSEREGKPMTLRCIADAEPDTNGFYWGTCLPAEE